MQTNGPLNIFLEGQHAVIEQSILNISVFCLTCRGCKIRRILNPKTLGAEEGSLRSGGPAVFSFAFNNE